MRYGLFPLTFQIFIATRALWADTWLPCSESWLLIVLPLQVAEQETRFQYVLFIRITAISFTTCYRIRCSVWYNRVDMQRVLQKNGIPSFPIPPIPSCVP